MTSWIATADRLADWSRARVVVAGLGRSGFAAADGLLELGAQVIVLDEADSPALREKATVLELLDAQVRLGAGVAAVLPDEVDLVVTSPGWRPSASVLEQARERGVPIWGEVELAWRMGLPDRQVPWLGVTGSHGRTATVGMLESMLTAAGLSVAVVGNGGRPVVEAVLDQTPYDVFVVELSSAQLHWTNSVSLHSAAVLNLAPGRSTWPADDGESTGDGLDYATDTGLIYQRVQQSCVYNVTDEATEKLVEEADVIDGARAIGFTTGIPAPSMLGVVDDVLVDRAFIAQRRDSAVEIAKLSDLPSQDSQTLANALAAAALARSFGASPQAVAEGLRRFATSQG